MSYDVDQIRKDFPILDRRVHGKPLVYLDNAATTQKPRQVIDALVHYYEHYNANIHRGLHTLAEEATAAYEESRLKAGRFINARASRAGDHLHAQHDGGDQSRRVRVGAGEPASRATRSCSRRWSTTATSCRGSMIALETGAVVRYIDIDETGHLRLGRSC